MKEIMAIAMRMDSMKILCEVPFKDKTLTELDVSGKDLGTEGALVVAAYLDGNGALSVLSLKKNNLCNKEAGNALAHALAGNTTLRELDVSCNQSLVDYSARDGPGFAEKLAVGIRDNGALSKLIMRENDIHGAEAGRAFADMLAQNTVLKELDLSSQKVGMFGNALDAPFAKEFAVGISGNGALTSLDLSSNNLTQGKWTGVGFCPDRHDPANYETDTKKDILSRNWVGLDGAAAIYNAVKSNVRIHDTCFVSFEQI
jgi:hypothetical protein